MSTTRVQSIELLRAFAAVAVMWYHFTLARVGYDLPQWMNDTSYLGQYGVQVFFIISGFVIPWMMWSIGYRVKDNILAFMVRRILRLDPAYFCAIALAVLLAYAQSLAPWRTGPGFEFPLVSIVKHIAYLPPFFGEAYLNTVFWTLGVEFQYYLLIAMAYPVVASPLRAVRLTLLAALVAASFVFVTAEFVPKWGAVFALGIVVFHYRTRLETPPISIALMVLINIAIGFSLEPVMAVICAMTTALIAFVDFKPLAILDRFAGMSYSIYLFHHMVGLIVINIGSRFFKFPGGGLLTLACALGVSLFVAWVMHRLVERPSQALSRKVPWVWPRPRPGGE